MWIRNSLLALILIAIAGLARADGLSGAVTPQIGGGIDKQFDGGISAPNIVAHHGGVGPNLCAGQGTLTFNNPCPAVYYVNGVLSP